MTGLQSGLYGEQLGSPAEADTCPESPYSAGAASCWRNAFQCAEAQAHEPVIRVLRVISSPLALPPGSPCPLLEMFVGTRKVPAVSAFSIPGPEAKQC